MSPGSPSLMPSAGISMPCQWCMQCDWMEVELSENAFEFHTFLDAVRRQTMTLAVGMYSAEGGDPRLQAVKWWRNKVLSRILPRMTAWYEAKDAAEPLYQVVIEEISTQLFNEARRLMLLREDEQKNPKQDQGGDGVPNVTETGPHG